MQTTKKITGMDVLDIQPLAGEFSYDENSQMKGKKYRRFSYNGVVFIAETEHRFCKDFDKAEVYAVTFGINEEGQFSLLAHNSYTQIENYKRFESKIKAFDRVVVESNPEELAAV